jgi:DNA repair protein RadA/Sms
VLLAIASSLKGNPLPGKMVAFGEVGLVGEVRPVQRGMERLKEAAKIGFQLAIVPRANAPKVPIEGLKVIAVDRVGQAIECIR